MSLRDGLINTVFLTFLHNQDAIGFFIGAIIALVLLLYKPSRFSTLLLIGFIVLLFGFEYNKHIIEPLQDQTLSSLGINGQGGSASTGVIRLFQKLLPLGFFILGWGSIFAAVISKGRRKKD